MKWSDHVWPNIRTSKKIKRRWHKVKGGCFRWKAVKMPCCDCRSRLKGRPHLSTGCCRSGTTEARVAERHKTSIELRVLAKEFDPHEDES